MKVIDLDFPKQVKITNGPVVLAMGFFDGVHRGHQAVIKTARKIADEQNEPLALMTFSQHPAVLFQNVPANEIQYLSTLSQKIELMERFGVDILYVLHLNQAFLNESPADFVEDYMVGLQANFVVAGFDYTYGRPKNLANMAYLPNYASGRFEVITVSERDNDGKKIGSTSIRNAIDVGDIDRANELLGYVYETSGKVVHGEARGRTLGFPTANIEFDVGQRIPGIGIYAVRLMVDQTWYEGMASVGRNVTFGENRPVTIEINLFDFNQDIYDKKVKVKWYRYMRGEIKFASADELVDQLREDQTNITQYFKESEEK